MTALPSDAQLQLFFRRLDMAGSSDRQERLAACDPQGELWLNHDLLSRRVRAGGRAAADLAVLLATSATTSEQLAYVVAGPFEDLWHADARVFEYHVLPRLPRAVVVAAIDGMVLPDDAAHRLRTHLASHA